MNNTLAELIEMFDRIYDSGYRFLDSVQDQVHVVEQRGISEVKTSAMHMKLKIDGEVITDEEKERMFNFIAFRKAIKSKDGKPVRLLGRE